MALSPDSNLDLAADLAARGIDPAAAHTAADKAAAAADRLYEAEWARYVEWGDDGDLDVADPDTADRWIAEAKPSERHFVRTALTRGQNTGREG